jgi:YVTN family beta-propeller protein
MKPTARASISLSLFAAALPLPLAGATLVVGNKAEATVSLIDLGTGKVAATLPTGKGPHEVAVSSDGRLALVTNYGTGPEPGGSLTLIDIPAAKVVRTIELGTHRRPHGVEWLSAQRALVTTEESKMLLEVDVEEARVVRALPTEQEVSHMVAVAPGGKRAYVANIGSGSMTAFDLEKGARLANLPTGDGAEGIAVAPGGRELWVTNRAADTVAVVDLESLQVVAKIPAPAFPIRVKLTPDGRRALVTAARSGELVVIDTKQRQVERRVGFALEGKAEGGRLMTGFGESPVPIGIVVDPGGAKAYVALANADRVAVVDLQSFTVKEFLTAGREPDGMAYSPLAPAAAPARVPPENPGGTAR